MLNKLKEIILDFQDLELETGTPRHLNVEVLPNKATVYMGVRRSGKSTFMFQCIQRLLDKGVSRQNILYLNFFDDRLHELVHTELNVIVEAYYSLYPEKKNTETIYCFFDEIQVVPGWESFVDRLMRTEKCQITVTGSSAHMLSKEIATEMRGRALSWEIFPFSFKEFLDYKKVEYTHPLSIKKRFFVQKMFEEFWETGVFPEVIGLKKHLRIKIHQEYFNVILFRDLIERHNVPHPKAIIDLAYKLVDNTASLYSVNRLTGYLKSLGHHAPKAAVSTYLEWFEDAYFLFAVKIFDASLVRRNTNPKKIYCIDHALVTSVTSGILINSGHLLENLIFTALRRVFPIIHYYKTNSGNEVDFIVCLPDRTYLLIQVCESIITPESRKRELSALHEAMGELKLTSGIVVTRHEEERVNVECGIIEVVSAWRFLLTPPWETNLLGNI